MPNQPSKISDWEEELYILFWSNSVFKYKADLEQIKSLISNLLSTQRTEVLEKVEKSIKGMPYKEECSILKSRVLEKINQLKNEEK